MNHAPERRDGRRAIGRAVASVYYTVVVAFATIGVVNVSRQVWGPSWRSHAPEDCRPGLLALATAVERARVAAGGASDDETAALERFRSALAPEWDHHEAIAASCRRDPAWASSLDVIERLRYAEERAVRRDVTELSPLRRKTEQLVATRLRTGP